MVIRGVPVRSATTGDSFVLTVTPVNDAPSITHIGDQIIAEDAVLGPISFTIGDVETAVGSLELTAGTSSHGMVPSNSIVFDGANSNRTVMITPAANQFSTTPITYTTLFRSATTGDSFVLTVTPVNDAPSITHIGDQIIAEDAVLGPISFTIGDVETAVGDRKSVV